MDVVYIIAIVFGGIFLLLFLICIILWGLAIKRNTARFAAIEEMYASDNLNKMEYDNAFYDDDVADMIYGTAVDTQVTIDEVLTERRAKAAALSAEESVFGKIESEGLEEVTGNYNPDDDK